MIKHATLLIVTLIIGGCAADTVSASLLAPPSHLGADVESSEDLTSLREPPPALSGKPLSSRVLSAIAFERSTGRDAHPSRLVPGQ